MAVLQSSATPAARSRRSRAKRLGSAEPRIFTKPLRELTPQTSNGFEAIAFAEDILGIRLLPWQKWFLIHSLELLPDGNYRFRTICLLVARQNGKTTVIQVRALWRMFLDGANLVLGTAQNLDVAEECWQGAVEMAEGVDELREEIAAVVQVNGKKSLRLVTGERYKVQAANRRGGRGLSGEEVILDELREQQTWDAWGAITKTTMAKEHAQIVCASNAGDATSIVLSHLRTIGIAEVDSRDTSVGLFEWSAPEGCAVDDWDAIGQANPALGHTIPEKAILDAMKTDPDGVFRTEVLCQWVENMTSGPIPMASWESRLDSESRIPEGARLAFAVDTSWDRETTWVAVAGLRADGVPHVEIVTSHYGTDWVLPWMRERLGTYRPVAIGLQGSGAPVSSIYDTLASDLGDVVQSIAGQDLARASGSFYDAVVTGPLTHLGQDQLTEALRYAVVRPSGDSWLWDRKHSPVDIAPLVAASEALYLLQTVQDLTPAPRPAPKRLR